MNGKQSLQRIPVDRLVAHEHNRTLDQGRVDEMANSIQKVGLLTPLVVTEHLTDYNKFLLLDLDAKTRAMVRTGEVGVGQATQAVRQVRAAVRTGTALGTPPANRKPKISVEPAWFTRKHPLYQAVELLCGHTDASAGRVRPTIGGVGCGQCWEQAIRNDETKNPTTQGQN